MTTHSPWLAAALLTVLALAPPARADYELEPAFPGLSFIAPTDIQPAIDGTYRLFVVEKGGVIKVFVPDDTATTARVFLDISDRVRTAGEAGLLGLTFHPDYAHNGEFFVFYVTKYPSRSILARYRVTSDPDVADANSETILIDSPQPTVYHNGGQLVFGNDGLLYIAMGDNAIPSNAQDLTDLPGSILRIDVDVDVYPLVGPNLLYEIPGDNPFAGNTSGYREEIFAYGFRNPWRFCIDRMTNEMWVADVGEDTYEEIDLVRPGGNYGWPLMEGLACYLPADCDTAGADLRLPLYSYAHTEGTAVIGGYRYWGTRLPELAGLYLFADYTGGVVWGLHYDGAGSPRRYDIASNAPILLTFGLGFGSDVLMASSDGYLYHLVRTVTSVGAGPAGGARLLGNYPNPFNPSTTIRYRLDRAADAAIDIVSVGGTRVRRLDAGRRGAGEQTALWNGETDRGGHAASGVYFCRLIVDGRAVDAIRLVLVQ